MSTESNISNAISKINSLFDSVLNLENRNKIKNQKKLEIASSKPNPPEPQTKETKGIICTNNVETEILSKSELDFLLKNIGNNEERSSSKVSDTSEGISQEILKTLQRPKNIITTADLNINQTIANVPSKGNGFARKFDVYEEEKAFLGIVVGQTDIVDTMKILKDFNQRVIKSPNDDSIYICPDLSLIIKFNRKDIVEELTLGSKFKGQTNKGIRIGDKMELAIKVYGKPDEVSHLGVRWASFNLFLKNGIITHIKLEK